ncbi:MAG: plasmid mobilization relaxosome protein MobC [Bacteroidetes bacterium]|nr:plasmid mobilization relaxosome protein MobC [Bacteroidota bacterium]
MPAPSEEQDQPGRAAASDLYPILKTRVSPAEHAEFCASAASDGKKPGRLLRALIHAHLSGEPVKLRRRHSAAIPVQPGAAELERFEIRIPSFLKTEVRKRAAAENMSSSEWVAALIQSVVMVEPVLTEKEVEAVSYANRELAAVGRNLNQIARSMNRAELIGVNFSKDEILTLQGIEVLKKRIGNLRDRILSLVTARNRAWGVNDDPAS